MQPRMCGAIATGWHSDVYRCEAASVEAVQEYVRGAGPPGSAVVPALAPALSAPRWHTELLVTGGYMAASVHA